MASAAASPSYAQAARASVAPPAARESTVPPPAAPRESVAPPRDSVTFPPPSILLAASSLSQQQSQQQLPPVSSSSDIATAAAAALVASPAPTTLDPALISSPIAAKHLNRHSIASSGSMSPPPVVNTVRSAPAAHPSAAHPSAAHPTVTTFAATTTLATAASTPRPIAVPATAAAAAGGGGVPPSPFSSATAASSSSRLHQQFHLMSSTQQGGGGGGFRPGSGGDGGPHGLAFIGRIASIFPDLTVDAFKQKIWSLAPPLPSGLASRGLSSDTVAMVIMNQKMPQTFTNPHFRKAITSHLIINLTTGLPTHCGLPIADTVCMANFDPTSAAASTGPLTSKHGVLVAPSFKALVTRASRPVPPSSQQKKLTFTFTFPFEGLSIYIRKINGVVVLSTDTWISSSTSRYGGLPMSIGEMWTRLGGPENLDDFFDGDDDQNGSGLSYAFTIVHRCLQTLSRVNCGENGFLIFVGVLDVKTPGKFLPLNNHQIKWRGLADVVDPATPPSVAHLDDVMPHTQPHATRDDDDDAIDPTNSRDHEEVVRVHFEDESAAMEFGMAAPFPPPQYGGCGAGDDAGDDGPQQLGSTTLGPMPAAARPPPDGPPGAAATTARTPPRCCVVYHAPHFTFDQAKMIFEFGYHTEQRVMDATCPPLNDDGVPEGSTTPGGEPIILRFGDQTIIFEPPRVTHTRDIQGGHRGTMIKEYRVPALWTLTSTPRCDEKFRSLFSMPPPYFATASIEAIINGIEQLASWIRDELIFPIDVPLCFEGMVTNANKTAVAAGGSGGGGGADAPPPPPPSPSPLRKIKFLWAVLRLAMVTATANHQLAIIKAGLEFVTQKLPAVVDFMNMIRRRRSSSPNNIDLRELRHLLLPSCDDQTETFLFNKNPNTQSAPPLACILVKVLNEGDDPANSDSLNGETIKSLAQVAETLKENVMTTTTGGGDRGGGDCGVGRESHESFGGGDCGGADFFPTSPEAAAGAADEAVATPAPRVGGGGRRDYDDDGGYDDGSYGRGGGGYYTGRGGGDGYYGGRGGYGGGRGGYGGGGGYGGRGGYGGGGYGGGYGGRGYGCHPAPYHRPYFPEESDGDDGGYVGGRGGGRGGGGGYDDCHGGGYHHAGGGRGGTRGYAADHGRGGGYYHHAGYGGYGGGYGRGGGGGGRW